MINKQKGVVDILVIVIVLVLGVAAVGFFMLNNSSEEKIVYVETSDPVYTLEQVSEHKEATDCWMAIDGKVYDVTEYIASEEHPAGKAILKGCGLDASEMFAGPHSEAAYDMLPQFEIGVLQ